jgi:hypothetical protein
VCHPICDRKNPFVSAQNGNPFQGLHHRRVLRLAAGTRLLRDRRHQNQQESRVSRATFYRIFQNKEDIIKAYFERSELKFLSTHSPLNPYGDPKEFIYFCFEKLGQRKRPIFSPFIIKGSSITSLKPSTPGSKRISPSTPAAIKPRPISMLAQPPTSKSITAALLTLR